MKFSPEIAELSAVVAQMYERLLAKKYQEVIFHDLAYRGLGSDFVAICPFHDACGVPTMHIKGSSPTWYCVAGCGRGTWIRYLQRRQGLSFWAALDKLTLAAEIDLRHFPHYERWKRESEQAEIYEKIMSFCREQLQAPEGKDARDYIASRKLSTGQLEAMEIGAIPDPAALQKFLDSSLFDKDLLLGSPRDGRPGAVGGIVALGSHRIVFPFRDEMGRIFSLFTRITPASAPKNIEKYRPISNLTDERQILYNMWTCRGSNTLLMVEGSFDCARACMHGLPDIVATNGVTILPEHVAILRRNKVRKILLVPDTDKVGQERAAENVDNLAVGGFDCSVVSIPREFKDVDSLIGELGSVGAEILKNAIDHAEPAMPWRVKKFAELYAKEPSALIAAGLEYSAKLARPEDSSAFLLALVEQTRTPLPELETAFAKLVQQKLPEVLKTNYLLSAKKCMQALRDCDLAGFESAFEVCKTLRKKLS